MMLLLLEVCCLFSILLVLFYSSHSTSSETSCSLLKKWLICVLKGNTKIVSSIIKQNVNNF